MDRELYQWVRHHAAEVLHLTDPNEYFSSVDQLISLAALYRTFLSQLHRPVVRAEDHRCVPISSNPSPSASSFFPAWLGERVAAAARLGRLMADRGVHRARLPNALRAGMQYFAAVWDDMDDKHEAAKTPLSMPVLAVGGERCLVTMEMVLTRHAVGHLGDSRANDEVGQ